MPMSYLWLLASAVCYPLTAGSQGIVTIETLGGSWETDRRVRVSRAHGSQQEDDDSMDWEGTVHEWCEAVTEAAARPSFPGAIEGWEPGPVEAAYRAALTTDRAPVVMPMDRAELRDQGADPRPRR